MECVRRKMSKAERNLTVVSDWRQVEFGMIFLLLSLSLLQLTDITYAINSVKIQCVFNINTEGQFISL